MLKTNIDIDPPYFDYVARYEKDKQLVERTISDHGWKNWKIGGNDRVVYPVEEGIFGLICYDRNGKEEEYGTTDNVDEAVLFLLISVDCL